MAVNWLFLACAVERWLYLNYWKVVHNTSLLWLDPSPKVLVGLWERWAGKRGTKPYYKCILFRPLLHSLREGNWRCSCSFRLSCLTAAGLVRDLSNQQSLQDSHTIEEKRSSTKMALLLDAGKQLDAVMSFRPLTGQQKSTCLATRVCVPHRLNSSSCFQPRTFQCMQSLNLYFVLVSMWCVLLPPRMRNALKMKIRRDQRRKQHACRLLVT